MGKGQAAEETGWRPEQKGIVKKEESPLRQHGEGDLVHFRELGVYGRLQRLTSVCSGPPQPISLPFSPRLTAFFAVGCCLILAGGMRVAVRYAAQPSKIPLLPLSRSLAIQWLGMPTLRIQGRPEAQREDSRP